MIRILISGNKLVLYGCLVTLPWSLTRHETKSLFCAEFVHSKFVYTTVCHEGSTVSTSPCSLRMIRPGIDKVAAFDQSAISQF